MERRHTVAPVHKCFLLLRDSYNQLTCKTSIFKLCSYKRSYIIKYYI